MSEVPAENVTEQSKTRMPSPSAQRSFLAALWRGDLTLPQVLAESNIDRRRLCKWMDSRSFQRRLQPIRDHLRQLRNFEAELLSCVAQARLSKSLEKSHITQKQLREISRTAIKNVEMKCKPRAGKPRCKAHQDVSRDRSQELLKRFDKAGEG